MISAGTANTSLVGETNSTLVGAFWVWAGINLLIMKTGELLAPQVLQIGCVKEIGSDMMDQALGLAFAHDDVHDFRPYVGSG